MDARRLACLRAMGIEVWVPRTAAGPAVPAPATQPPAAGGPVPAPAAADAWSGLREEVLACTACPLHAGRTQAVFGVGDTGADIMFIGEAPGADEDRQGEPFVGRAGQLLTAMIRAMGLSREQVYIANILKCRPPRNRDPQPEEVATCTPWLNRQIELVRPRVLVALGRISAHYLLRTDTPLGRLRGRLHRHEPTGTPVVVTYHPAYLLRSPAEKRKAWADLQFVHRALAREGDPGQDLSS